MKKLIFLMAILCGQANAQTEVYHCVDENGKGEYKNSGAVEGCKRVDLPGITLPKNWISIDKTKESEAYLDKDSFAVLPTYRKAWIMTSFEKGQDYGDNKQYLSVKFLSVIRCSEKSLGNKNAVYYSERLGYGNVLSSHSKEMKDVKFRDVVPDSFGESVLKKMCSYKK